MNILSTQPGARFAFEDDADEELWAMRDYFWALRLGLVGGENTRSNCRSFRAGYAAHAASRREQDCPPPARSAA